MKIFLIIFLLFAKSLLMSAEQEIILDSRNGEIYYSDSTEPGVEYIITVEGTYSMWPQFNENNEKGCSGADACYIYDVPQEEMDAFRWPPDTVEIPLLGKIPFLPLPQYVGDDKEYNLPPKEIAIPSIRISLRKNTGFRINDEPLPKFPIENITHRYQISKIGDGDPFKFQILDSAFNIVQEQTLARYEDNCGELKVTIKKVEEEGVNICDISPICVDGKYVGIKLNASVFEKDTSLIESKKNLLNTIELNQISIVDDGRFICDIDSIDCTTEAKSNAVGFIIDKSGSMEAAIVEGGNISRIEASKNAIKKFISGMREIDSSFIMSFSEFVALEQDWTNNIDILNNKVDNLTPGGSTQFYKAVLDGAEKIKTNQSPNRYLIVLSDGANRESPIWQDSYVKKLSDINVPIYFIALGFNNTPDEIIAREHMQLMANGTNGKVFDVRDENELDKVYQDIFDAKRMSDCCTIYFPIDPCEEGESKTIRLLFAPEGNKLYSEYITFDCFDCDKITTGIIENNDYSQYISDFSLYPNPNNGSFNIKFNNNINGKLVLNIYDINGDFVSNIFNEFISTGEFSLLSNTSNLKTGKYFIQVKLNDTVQYFSFVIER